MFDVGESLAPALEGARVALHAATTAVTLANVGEGPGRRADAAMAQTADAVIFTEALLAAERSRFEEIKAVTK